MQLTNATKMIAGYTLGMDPEGRESVVVAIKGTFALTTGGSESQLAEEQVPLVLADEFTGEPGYSATVYECDYAPEKPCCDVMLNGSAYALGGKPTTKVAVSMQVGAVNKSFNVIGNRVWEHTLLGVTHSNTEPFTVMPISYDNAYGGMDTSHEDAAKHDAYRPNLVGVGFHVNLAKEAVDKKPLPNTEEPGQPIRSTNGKYRPMAFGAVTRASLPRASYGGTYDDDWTENTFPFLPADFDSRYFQCAPLDQQLPHPVGGEEVVLTNLTPQGRTAFHLPTIDMPVEFTNASYERTEQQAVLDTIVLEPDLDRFTCTWRASHPLKRNMLEMRQCVVGRMPRGWYRARDLGKTYYPSLGALVGVGQGGEEDEI